MPSAFAKNNMSIMESAKGGMAKSMCPRHERVLSDRFPGFLLHRAAMGNEIRSTKIRAITLIPYVTGSLDEMSSPTGVPKETEFPKSPLVAFPSHFI